MAIYLEKDDPYLWVKKIFAILIIAGIVTGFLGLAATRIIQAKEEKGSDPSPVLELVAIQGNSFLAVSNSELPIKPAKKLKMIITAYSSTIWQTDESPYLTASGKVVEEGIVANNLLPFGTEVRIPELYGDKVFVVEDRMHWRKGYYHLDIWFPEYLEAKNFGAKITYIEVLEN